MKLAYTYWKDNGFYIGHLNEFPEYNTQGKSLKELEEMLKSLYADISNEDFQEIQQKVGVLEYEMV